MRSLRSGVFVLPILGVVACTTAGDGATTDASDVIAACPPALAELATVAETCADVDAPDVGPAEAFSTLRNAALSLAPALHRGRDAVFTPDEQQWVLGRMAYGPDLGLVDEAVDLWVLRGCSGTWEKLGSTRTTTKGSHETIEGMEDDGGRVYFPIPEAQRLGVGRHRIRLVVAGDRSQTDQYIEVLPRGTPFFVSDVDGTLTERLATDSHLICDEESEFPALLRTIIEGALPQPRLHEGTSAVFGTLAKAGYRPFYLSARSELLGGNTRAFLRESKRGDGRGDLPAGIVHTTFTLLGAKNEAAEAFKADELARLEAKGFRVVLGFGNRTSDQDAYTAANVPYRFFYENPSTWLRDCSNVDGVPALPESYAQLASGDFRIDHYERLAPAVGALAPVCSQLQPGQ